MSRYIAIEGPIGVGKSSLAKMLGERFEVEPIYEHGEKNPFLGSFYRNKTTYAFQTQMFFLVSRYKQLSELSQVDLFNQVTICDYIMERDLVFAELNLDKSEYRLYLDIYNQLVKHIPAPDLVVYLQADTSTLMKRIAIRNREVEKGISEEYINKVNSAFNDHFFNYRGGPLLIINTNNIDFVANEEDFEKLVKKVRSDVQGVEFFNPLGSLL
jgi:deoxyadenosine/deoxycytidine kinase